MIIALFGWLAEQTPAIDPTSFAGYGVVGALALAGLTFAFTAYRQVNNERIAAQAKLLAVYETVLPALENSSAAMRECTQLLQMIRHDAELERARREGTTR